MEFSPNNNIVKLCLQAMKLEDDGKTAEASELFLQAWNEATADFEKFIAAYYVSRHQKTITDKIKWLETALQLALKINDDAVRAAFAPLYTSIAQCYEELGNVDNAKRNYELANSFTDEPS